MSTQPISSDGKTITLSRLGGETIEIKSHDLDRQQIDISDRTMKFIVGDDLFETVLTTDPADDKGLLLVITMEQVNLIPDVGTTFALVDVAEQDKTQPKWSGRIKVKD